jgi:threonine/homoserine/homoserine lactone efflux protein
LILFLTTSLALIVAPGPDNFLVLTRGIAQGWSAALVSAVGVSVALVIHLVFAAVGLSALLPQFAAPIASGVAPPLLALGLTFALLTWMIFSALGYFSGSLGNSLVSRPKLADILRWLTGGVLMGLGLRLALPHRR